MPQVKDDAGNYFQTTDSIAEIERKAAKSKNKHGSPIKLGSKILAVHPDPSDANAVYVAEAAGDVRRINVETGNKATVLSGAGSPLTSLALDRPSNLMFAGCWDKTTHSAVLDRFVEPKQAKLQRFPSHNGHTDFVKCLITATLDKTPILISGGADATIIMTNITTNKILHKLKGHTKALQHLAIDPMTQQLDSLTLFSASSDREIRRWQVSLSAAHELTESIENPILAHETSIYMLYFDSEGDLWTASADKSAKHLVRSRNWETDTVLQHPDFVRDVVVAEAAGVVVTACRDEEVRVWDAGSGECVCTYSGHYEEVTGLCLVQGGKAVVSVSIDGTLRRWGLTRGDFGRYLEEVEKEKEGKVEEEKTAEKKGPALTAEEEAELAELMDED